MILPVICCFYMRLFVHAAFTLSFVENTIQNQSDSSQQEYWDPSVAHLKVEEDMNYTHTRPAIMQPREIYNRVHPDRSAESQHSQKPPNNQTERYSDAENQSVTRGYVHERNTTVHNVSVTKTKSLKTCSGCLLSSEQAQRAALASIKANILKKLNLTSVPITNKKQLSKIYEIRRVVERNEMHLHKRLHKQGMQADYPYYESPYIRDPPRDRTEKILVMGSTRK